MSYQVNVENFGKIKKAKVEVSPLTFFVGDNNSGKSYLLTLLWGLQSEKLIQVLTRNIEKIDKKYYQDIYDKIKLFVNDAREPDDEISFDISEFEGLINQLLKKNRSIFVRKLFNSESMSIGKLSIKITRQHKIVLGIIGELEEGRCYFVQYKRSKTGIIKGELEQFLKRIFELMVQSILSDGGFWLGKNNYFPASRTGFLLAKDSINQIGREKTFTPR